MCVSPTRNAHFCKPCEGILEPKSRFKSALNGGLGSKFASKRANLGPKLVVQNAPPTILEPFFGHLWPLAVAPLLCQGQSCAKKASNIKNEHLAYTKRSFFRTRKPQLEASSELQEALKRGFLAPKWVQKGRGTLTQLAVPCRLGEK